MLRHQWKEARNIVNNAIARVVRPLQLRDLFFSNVLESNPELFYEKENLVKQAENYQKKIAASMKLNDSQLDEKNMSVDINNGSLTEKTNDIECEEEDIQNQSQPKAEIISIYLKQQLKETNTKIPNMLINDFKFT